ncbi:MAG: TusE/DsrC/DsvC family sulfur relay protein [Notoacmeibacter sp.]|nr:TusE/DsrC/DsvC family sulfur relay protein [Notoacmeibacter sp.]
MRVRPDILRTETISGRSVTRDEAGYLVDPELWDESIARHLAEEEGLKLEQRHWAIINFMRSYLEQHGIIADARFVFRFLAEMEGTDTAAGRRLFFELFPYGYVKQACKIAGMRQPRAWSTG